VPALNAGRRTLKMCFIEVVLFSIVAVKTLTFHKVQIFSWLWQ